MEKYKGSLYWIRIYTEHQLGDKKICDVYFENIKTKEVICYEIQNSITSKWTKETNDFYKNYEKIFFTTDWILIKENDMSYEIEKLQEQIKELII